LCQPPEEVVAHRHDHPQRQRRGVARAEHGHEEGGHLVVGGPLGEHLFQLVDHEQRARRAREPEEVLLQPPGLLPELGDEVGDRVHGPWRLGGDRGLVGQVRPRVQGGAGGLGRIGLGAAPGGQRRAPERLGQRAERGRAGPERHHHQGALLAQPGDHAREHERALARARRADHRQERGEPEALHDRRQLAIATEEPGRVALRVRQQAPERAVRRVLALAPLQPPREDGDELGGRRPSRGALVERGGEQRGELVGQRARVGRRRDRPVGRGGSAQRGGGPVGERAAAAEQLAEHDPEGPDVGRGGGWFTPPQLGREVLGSPPAGPAPVAVREQAREPEVDHPDAAVGRQDHVLGLQVAVDDPGGVPGLHAARHVERDPHRLADRDGPVEPAPQVEAVEQLHRQPRLPAPLAGREHGDHVGGGAPAR
jgi:hypothetical protein